MYSGRDITSLTYSGRLSAALRAARLARAGRERALAPASTRSPVLALQPPLRAREGAEDTRYTAEHTILDDRRVSSDPCLV